MDELLELFSFQGRANRRWYFWHILLDDFIAGALFLIGMVLATIVGEGWLALPFIGIAVGALTAGMAITVKRLHDLGRPGWHLLGAMIPIYNIILGFQLLFEKGTIGPNAYGPDPLAGTHTAGYLEDTTQPATYPEDLDFLD